MKNPYISLKSNTLLWWLVAAVAVVVVGAWWLLLVRRPPVPRHPLRAAGTTLYRHAAIAVSMASVAHTDSNIDYCGTKNRAQQLDLYLPKNQPAPHPLVVFIHGGGWSLGSKADPIVSDYGPALVKQGIALASLNYRMAPRYRYPAADQDVSCALSYLYGHAQRYQLNNQQLGLFGASAGGQLAAYAALSPGYRSQPWRQSLRGVADFYGVADLVAPPPRSRLAASVRRFLGPQAGPGLAAAASPVSYAGQPGAPPFLIFHGTNDHRVPLTQSQQLAGDLTAGGNQATLVVVQHGGHGFGHGDQPSPTQIQQQLTQFFTHVFTHAT